jgi:hypothetical protein
MGMLQELQHVSVTTARHDLVGATHTRFAEMGRLLDAVIEARQ